MGVKFRFTDLNERIDELHFRFVPQLDPTGTYSDADYDRMSAFRLLVHAEIERFIELVVEDAILKLPRTIAVWKSAGMQSEIVDALVKHTEVGLRDSVKKNNGVKSDNVLKMLKPFGITGVDLVNVWLQTMDTYGEIRGGHAHNTRRAVQPIDPKTEQSMVYNQILPELRRLEELVQKRS